MTTTAPGNEGTEFTNGELVSLRAYRIGRVRQALASNGLDCAVLIDPINIRYATGTRNMQVWSPET